MKPITSTLLATVFVIGMVILPLQAQPSRSALRLGSSCSTLPMLPKIFFSKFDCQPCCQASDFTFGNCMHSGKGKCQCIKAAFDACLDGGCGPCNCCAEWIEAAQLQGCDPIINHSEKKPKSR